MVWYYIIHRALVIHPNPQLSVIGMDSAQATHAPLAHFLLLLLYTAINHIDIINNKEF